MLTCGGPRLRAIPSIVRRPSLPLKTAAASTIACSSLERRRSVGSGTYAAAATLVAPAEDAAEAERPPTSRTSDCGPDRAALAHPAVAQRRLLAELADLDELADPIRGEAIRPLAQQERALAHGAAVDLHDPDRPHEGRTI